MNRTTTVGAILALVVTLGGCSGSSGSSLPSSYVANSTATSGTAPAATTGTKQTEDTIGGGNMRTMLSILLGDAPPILDGMNVTAINIGITAVNVVESGAVTNVAQYPTPYVVNVMAFGGQPSWIGIGQVYSGSYDHVQFVVSAAASNVIADGKVYPIQWQVNQKSQSSAGAGLWTQTTGNGQSITMTVGGTLYFQGEPAAAVDADFNATESLNVNSAGQIVAQPTLFAVATADEGSIQGRVLNAQGQPVVNAVVVAIKTTNLRVGNTTTTDQNGNFLLHTLEAEPMRLTVYNNYTTASGQNIIASGADASIGASFTGPTVTVQSGQIAQVGTLKD